MNSTQFPVLMVILFLVAAVLAPIIRKKFDKQFRWFVNIVFLLALALNIGTLWHVYEKGAYTYNFGDWSQKIGVQFMVDEFSALISLMIVVVGFLIAIYSLKDIEHEIHAKQIQGFYTLMFLMMYAMTGIAYTNDIFNMYVFVEILSITACGIISVKRVRENFLAALRYLILSSIGSASLLFGIALLYMVTGRLNISDMAAEIAQVGSLYPTNIMVSVGFIVTGLSIKSALFPLHIWLPDAHSSAPTPSSAFLSGLVVKAYIIVLIKILFKVIGPDIIISLGIHNYIVFFAVLSMIMGSVFAIGQTDLKRMLAYSSVAQIGYIYLGIGLFTREGLSAALFHMISHALMKTLLFLCAGAIIYRTGKRDIRDLKGIAADMPLTIALFAIGVLGMVGIPGVNGFMSKVYLSLAVINDGQPWLLVAIFASSLLNAIYYMPIIMTALSKKEAVDEEETTVELKKVPTAMTATMVVLGFACILFGLYPTLLTNIIEKATYTFLLIS